MVSLIAVDHLADQLHYELHHHFGLFIEHALPQFVHHPLGKVKHVVDQDLVISPSRDGHWCVFSCGEKVQTHERVLNTD